MADKLKVKEPATSKRRGKRNAAYKESWEQHKQEQSPKICINILIIVNIVNNTIIDNKIFNSIKRHPIITIITLLITVTSVFGSVYSEEVKNLINEAKQWVVELINKEESDEPTARKLISPGKNPDDTMIKYENGVTPHKLISPGSSGNYSPSEVLKKDYETQILIMSPTSEIVESNGKIPGKQLAANESIKSKGAPFPDRSERRTQKVDSEYSIRINLYTEINSVRIDLNSFKPKVQRTGGKLRVLIKNDIIDERLIPVEGESNTIDWKIDEDKAWDLCLQFSEKVEKGDPLKLKLEKIKILETCIEVAKAFDDKRIHMVSIFERMEQ